jgi:hypothetical protein
MAGNWSKYGDPLACILASYNREAAAEDPTGPIQAAVDRPQQPGEMEHDAGRLPLICPLPQGPRVDLYDDWSGTDLPPYSTAPYTRPYTPPYTASPYCSPYSTAPHTRPYTPPYTAPPYCSPYSTAPYIRPCHYPAPQPWRPWSTVLGEPAIDGPPDISPATSGGEMFVFDKPATAPSPAKEDAEEKLDKLAITPSSDKDLDPPLRPWRPWSPALDSDSSTSGAEDSVSDKLATGEKFDKLVTTPSSAKDPDIGDAAKEDAEEKSGKLVITPSSDKDLDTGDSAKAAATAQDRTGFVQAAANWLQQPGQVGEHCTGCLPLIPSHPQAWVDLSGTKDLNVDERRLSIDPGDQSIETSGFSAQKSDKTDLPRGRTSSGFASSEDDWPPRWPPPAA